MLAVVFAACSKKDSGNQTNNSNSIPIDVKTYEAVTLSVNGTFNNNYTATFGDTTVDLIKSSDSTLVFLVPNVPAGSYTLSFESTKVKYAVTKTLEVNADSLVAKVFVNIDNQVKGLSSDTSTSVTSQISKTKQYKQELTTTINKLSSSQKRDMALFYVANKQEFESFNSSVFTTFDGPTTFSTQSGCPRNNFRDFYGCTADNLSSSARELKNVSKEALKFIGLGLISGELAPASFGLSMVGSTLAFSAAAYLLITDAKPAACKFGSSVGPFLEANWILTTAVFKTVTTTYPSETSTSLGLTPEFRSVASTDNDVNTGTTLFNNSFSTLSGYWNKLITLFGKVPTYKTNTKPTT